jgi:hypothetical protein
MDKRNDVKEQYNGQKKRRKKKYNGQRNDIKEQYN